MRHWPEVGIPKWMEPLPKKKKIFFLWLLLILARGVRRKNQPWSYLFSALGRTLWGISWAADRAQRTVLATVIPPHPSPGRNPTSGCPVLNWKLWLKHFLWLELHEGNAFCTDSPTPDGGVHTILRQSHQQTFSLLPSWLPSKVPEGFYITSGISIPWPNWAKARLGVWNLLGSRT